MPREKLSRRNAAALAKEAARALALLDELTDRYGAEPVPNVVGATTAINGTVIRFAVQYGPRVMDAFPPSVRVEELQRVTPQTYVYAAIRAAGLWYVTGENSPQGVEWEELLGWIEDHATAVTRIEAWFPENPPVVALEPTRDDTEFDLHP